MNSITMNLTASNLNNIREILKQLEFYWADGNHSDHLKKDIEGYKLIIASKSEKNATMFLNLKHTKRSHFKNNLEIIDYMKSQNQWETQITEF